MDYVQTVQLTNENRKERIKPMDDEQIIQLFFERSEQAIRELDIKYGSLCHSLSYNILGSREDAEECINDAYQAVWSSIPPTRPLSLQAYLCKVTRNVSLARYHHNSAAKRNSSYTVAMQEIEELLSAPETVEAAVDARELAELIEGFLERLNRENRVIFMLRYGCSESYAAIAKRVGLSRKNVSVRLTRIRQQMKDYLREKEVFI